MPKYDKTVAVMERIIFYCDEVQAFTERFGKTYDAFKNDLAYQRACSMCILQIGELATRLNEDFRKKYNIIPWANVCGMRNRFAHDYDNMFVPRIWETIADDIPALRDYCIFILSESRGKDK